MSLLRSWGFRWCNLLQTCRSYGAGGSIGAICYRHVAPTELDGSMWAACSTDIPPNGAEIAP